MKFTSPFVGRFGPGLAGLFLAIFLILLGRLGTLELTDLIDPTESRYAAIAQEMLLSGKWLVPQVQRQFGVEPYLGKPPLHFWLTAISYSVLGVEEWTSRLPSFFGMLLVLGSIWLLLKSTWRDPAWTMRAMLICISLPVFFFLSGSSVIDVTLTAFISLSVVCFYLFFQQASSGGSRAVYWSVLATVAASLAFLTKGPVALVLIAMPLVGFLVVRGRMRELWSVRWILLITVFLTIISPWFLAAERQNPGFIRYFVWNENIARYLFKEYGDKYGSGHVQPYGMAWVMFLGAVIPWLAVLVFALRKKLFSETRRLAQSDDVMLLALAWTLSPLVFFTFVRQLHIGYIIPAFPGFALLVASALRCNLAPFSNKWLERMYGVMVLVAVIGGMGFGCTPRQLISVICFLVVSYFALRSWARRERSVEYVAAALSAFYLGSLCLVAPWLSQNLSSSSVLDTVVAQSLVPKLTIGSFTDSTYSLYWESGAWKDELGAPINVSFVDPASPIPGSIDVLLVQEKYLKKNANVEALRGMAEQGREGQWVYFVPKYATATLSGATPVMSNWDHPIKFPDSEAEAVMLGNHISGWFR